MNSIYSNFLCNRNGNLLQSIRLMTTSSGPTTDYRETLENMFADKPQMKIESILQLISAANCNPDAVEILVPKLKEEMTTWQIKRVDHFKALTQLLKQKKHELMDIHIEEELGEEDIVNLSDLLSTMKELYSGRLMLKLDHSFLNYQPLDVRITSQLQDAQSVTTAQYMQQIENIHS